MVRRIVGVLAAVGRGEMKPADAAPLLKRGAARGRKTAALTAPAAGLFLETSATRATRSRTDQAVVVRKNRSVAREVASGARE